MSEHVLIIAEAGVNHNGDIELAKKMIDSAKAAGVDIVKFQTSINSTSKFAEKAEYQKKNTGDDENQYDMIKKLRLSFDQHRDLKKYCDSIGIEYLSTPFDFDSIDFLNELCSFFKVPSGEIINVPYIERIAKTHKPVIMSTGMGNLDEIKNAIDILIGNGTPDIKLLQCTTQYPTPYEDVNLRAMLQLREKFGYEVGISDHSKGIEVPIAATALGATVIEKHFTLDRNLPGPDQKASIEPDELKKLVESVRNIEKALGTGIKEPCESELENLYISRKSIVAKRNIKKGEIFSEEKIVPRHAGRGISPARWYEVIGKTAKRDFEEDEMIEI